MRAQRLAHFCLVCSASGRSVHQDSIDRLATSCHQGGSLALLPGWFLVVLCHACPQIRSHCVHWGTGLAPLEPGRAWHPVIMEAPDASASGLWLKICAQVAVWNYATTRLPPESLLCATFCSWRELPCSMMSGHAPLSPRDPLNSPLQNLHKF